MSIVSELPSFRKFAESAMEAMQSHQLVIVAFPNDRDCALWVPELSAAIGALGPLYGFDSRPIYREEEASSDLMAVLAEMAGKPSAKVEGFLRAYDSDPPLLLKLDGRVSPETMSWQVILGIIQGLKHANPETSQRRVLIVASDCDVDPLSEMANVRVFRIWNAITWEELRLAAHGMLGAQQREIVKVWMVATYTGACNYDFSLLEKLCESQPKYLRKVVEVVKASLGNGAQDSIETAYLTAGGSTNDFWSIPERFVENWDKGCLYGMTIERGAAVPWSVYSNDFLEGQIKRQIWVEQMSGLLPMIVKIGFSLNEKLASIRPAIWKKLCEAAGIDAHAYDHEATDVIQGIGKSGMRVGNTTYSLLKKIREVRNGLAHLRPAELKDLEKIWDEYQGILLRAQTGEGE